MKTTKTSAHTNPVLTLFAKAFGFFSSLRLAVFLLLSLMAVLSAGTFLESLHGTDTARLLVYQTPWFSLLLLFLGINVAGAALDRYPWKKKHTGFVITHLGIIIILIGSYITQRWMIDGQMAITEGDEEHRISIAQPLLYVYSEELNTDTVLEVRPEPFPWTGRKTLIHEKSGKPNSFQLDLIQYLPRGRISQELTASEQGAPAANIVIANSFVNQKISLIEDDPVRGVEMLGPAAFSFSKEPLVAQTAKPIKTDNYLEFKFDQKSIKLTLPEKLSLPAKMKLEGTDFEVELLEVFQNARVVEMKLIEDTSTRETNPAVRFNLIGPDLEEKHTAFAKFPDFPTVHGMKPSSTGAKILYHAESVQPKGPENEVRLLVQNGELMYQVKKGSGVLTNKVKVGEVMPLGWMDLTMKVEQFFPHAALENRFTAVENTASGPDITTAMQLELRRNNESTKIWLTQGVKEHRHLAGTDFLLMFGDKRIPSGFRLQLKDFKIEYYPGTSNPASFSSDVVLKDDARGLVKEATISMNNPLVYKGYRIYQSGYQAEPGQPEVSIFSVGKDWGVPFQYIGTIIMVTGIIMQFFIKRFSTAAGRIA